ncbi:7349_t:CDS:2, partial [Cetraspora pellucida]
LYPSLFRRIVLKADNVDNNDDDNDNNEDGTKIEKDGIENDLKELEWYSEKAKEGNSYRLLILDDRKYPITAKEEVLNIGIEVEKDQMLTNIEPMAEGTNENEKSETPNHNCHKIVNIEEDKNGIEVEKEKCKALRYLPMYGPCIFDPGGLTLSRGTRP